ncbi:MAG: hypothetical protein HOH42_15590 [Ilumatobacter sp.]|uniref:hypothetical protein n=1 Tax=Ilumatobacter sp. TaxID=1967498 RepID=UPI0037537FFC|nr:hypothetical protein [Ilumatobacter sp.]
MSGTVLDGTYEDQVTFPRFSESGTWTVGRIIVRDYAGNWEQYDATQAALGGFTSTITVQ